MPEKPALPRLKVYCLQPHKNIFEFHAVRANILYRRGANSAGYEAEVLQTTITGSHRPCYQIVPGNASARAHPHTVFERAHHLDAADSVEQDGARPIFGKYYIAAAAKHQKRLGQRAQRVQEVIFFA